MKKIICLLITICIFFSQVNFSLAQEGKSVKNSNETTATTTDKNTEKDSWFSRTFYSIKNKLFNPMKQTVDNLPNDTQRGINYIIDRAKEEKEIKEELLKEEIKEEAKKIAQKETEKNVSRLESWLSPLKSKIQQGSDIIRKGYNKVRDYFKKIFFKE